VLLYLKMHLDAFVGWAPQSDPRGYKCPSYKLVWGWRKWTNKDREKYETKFDTL